MPRRYEKGHHMDILSFAFGILAAVAVAIVMVLVVIIVKVISLEKRLAKNQIEQERLIDDIYRKFDQYAKLDNTTRDLNEFDDRLKSLMAAEDIKFNDASRNLADNVSEIYREMDERDESALEKSKSYTDSRIDKITANKQ